MKTAQKLTAVLLLFSMGTGLLAGCAQGQDTQSEKTVVTMDHYFEDSFTALEQLVETTYPDIDLQPTYYLSDSFTSETVRELRNSRGSDLIISTQPSTQYSQDYLLDISGEAFCAGYTKNVMENLAVDGKTYFIPFPGMYHGYLYNKSIFEEQGIALPTNNTELKEAAKKLTAAGIVNTYGTSYGMKLYNNSIFGYYLMGYAAPDFLSTTEGIDWIEQFYKKTGTFTGTWESILSSAFTFTEEGILNPSTLDKQKNNVDVYDDMATGNLAMAYYPAVDLDWIKKGNLEAVAAGRAKATYEYGVMPFFSDTGRSAWTINTPECYIGINKSLTDKKAAAKLDACKRILSIISTQEGQDAINTEIRGGVSYLEGCKLSNALIPTGLEKVVADGYVYTMKYPEKMADTVGKYYIDMMMGDLTPAQCAAAIDNAYKNGNEENDYAFSVVGTMDSDALVGDYNVRLGETEIGNMVTDAISELTGATIAVANGGGIRSSLYKGDVTGEDLLAVCPYDNQIVVLKMTGKTLKAMLENGLSALDNEKIPGGRFLQISGASYTFDSSKAKGSRLVEVKLAKGKAIDDGATYEVAVNDYMCGAKGYDEGGNGDGYTMLNVYSDTAARPSDLKIVKETGKTYRDAIVAYFEKHQDEKISPKLEERIKNVVP